MSEHPLLDQNVKDYKDNSAKKLLDLVYDFRKMHRSPKEYIDPDYLVQEKDRVDLEVIY